LAWIAEEEAIALLKNNPEISLYSNSENALAWIDQYYGESIIRSITSFKKKVKFRELIKELFPTLFQANKY
jgi:hypothetical protein